MSPALAKSLDNERFLARLMYLLKNPTSEMIAVGHLAIVSGVVAEYVGATAPRDIFTEMAQVAMKQAEQ